MKRKPILIYDRTIRFFREAFCSHDWRISVTDVLHCRKCGKEILE